jgi:hypothetical protein
VVAQRRRLENGLERPCGRSRPAPRHLASLVVADAFAGALTRGSFKTIPASEETTNERSSAHRAVQALAKSMRMARGCRRPARLRGALSRPNKRCAHFLVDRGNGFGADIRQPRGRSQPSAFRRERAQNPDHSAATASASTSAPRRTAWRTSTASACKLTNRARLRALCRWLGAVPQPAAISRWCVQYARTLSARTKQFGPSRACLQKRAQRLGKLGRKKAVA